MLSAKSSIKSYRKKDHFSLKELDEEVGSPLDLHSRLYYGTTKYEIDRVFELSPQLFDLFSNSRLVKIRFVLRTKGLIVIFYSDKDRFVWPVPFNKMSFYNSRYISIYSEENFIKFEKI